MEAKDIVKNEIDRQAKFGYEPSWEDFVIAGQSAGLVQGKMDMLLDQQEILIEAKQAGMKEVVECANEAKITTDVFQEDGSVILRKGDIVIPQLYWQVKLKEWGIK